MLGVWFAANTRRTWKKAFFYWKIWWLVIPKEIVTTFITWPLAMHAWKTMQFRWNFVKPFYKLNQIISKRYRWRYVRDIDGLYFILKCIRFNLGTHKEENGKRRNGWNGGGRRCSFGNRWTCWTRICAGKEVDKLTIYCVGEYFCSGLNFVIIAPHLCVEIWLLSQIQTSINFIPNTRH